MENTRKGLWRELEPAREGPEYLFLDEIQVAKDWQTWLKHQVDFERNRRRIAVTGSATPLVTEGQESGVGRWQTIRLATLSFYEYLQLKKIAAPNLPAVTSLRDLFDLPETRLAAIAADNAVNACTQTRPEHCAELLKRRMQGKYTLLKLHGLAD